MANRDLESSGPKFRVGDRWDQEVVTFVDLVGEGVSDVAIPPTLLQNNDLQVLAYYDADRVLTVADRNVRGIGWDFRKLPSTIGWDSHNYVALGFDRHGRLHVAGNMHASPLQYWIINLEDPDRLPQQVEVLLDRARELEVTYPEFLRTSDGEMLFTYRDGKSGSGDFVALRWDDTTERYNRITDGPLIHGDGKRNAYLDSNAPILGPDGVWHILWVWRDSPDASSTHDVNYARSTDLASWTAADGRPLDLPLTTSSLTVVDPIPVGQGLINNNVRLGFLPNDQPVAVYHRRDSTGSQQLWAAIFDGTQWVKQQLTDWSFRWDFHGEGSLDFQIEIGTPVTSLNGLSVDVRRGEEVLTFFLGEDLAVTTRASAAPWSPLRRRTRDDGSYDRCAVGYDWTPTSQAGRWLVSYASVLEQRDQQTDTEGPKSLPLVLLQVSPVVE